MSYTRCYSRINWLNKSQSLSTPLGATNLNKMDKALETIDSAMASISAQTTSIDTTKADKTQLKGMIVDFAYNDKTGVMTLTRYDGTTITVDTAIEKMAVNFLFDAKNQQLIITLEDGTKQYVDMSALITQYEFSSTDSIAFTVASNGKVSAIIRKGSVTRDMLSAEVLSAIITSESNAKSSEKNALDYSNNASMDAKLAQSYSIGGSGIRDGEDTDNAKFYSEQAKSIADVSKQNLEAMKEEKQSAIDVIDSKLSKNIAKFNIDLETGHLKYEGGISTFSIRDNGHLNWEVDV